MGRQVKCPYCEQSLDKEEALPYKKRYYHTNCFNTWQREAEDRKSLYEYICELYNLDAPTGMIRKQIKDFQEEYKYKLKGIELALKYFYELLGNNPQEHGGIGIVPYIYEDAKRNYIEEKRVIEAASKFEERKELHFTLKEAKDEIPRDLIDIAQL
ncbi:hypothetical protein [Bacillus safensis]|uniref:hypothetical protein n=1 Tax=Bacillus safensis TaxID=561879 RepID=UPI003C21C072